jgi:membrane associated rhomboid family serine protease
MRPASVGFQCPDDVAAGAQATRTAVNPVGGPTTPRQPVVTYVIVALNVLAFVLEGLPLGGLPSFEQTNAFVQRFTQINALVPDEPYRLVTATFLHDGILHIGLNMLILVLIGRQLEQILGWARYLLAYLVCGFGGSVAVYVLDSSDTYGLGASGGIFGLFAVFYLVAKRLRADANGILVTIGINLVLTVLIPNVSIWAHAGGLVTGAVVGLIYTRLPPRPRVWQVIQLAAVFGIAVLLVVVTVVRSASGV